MSAPLATPAWRPVLRRPRRSGSRTRPGWATWAVRRVLGGVGVLWAVATIVFVAIRLIPGDPALAILGGPGSQASAEAVAHVRAEYGLDRPVLWQYLVFLGRLATGDLGDSYAFRTPVATLLAEELPVTLTLAAAGLVAAWLLAVAAAWASTRRGRIAPVVTSAITVTASVMPHFWLGSVLIVVFATGLGWFPAVSDGTVGGWVLPVVTVAVPVAGYLAETVRDGVLDADRSAFALAARARGETRAGLFGRHLLRHAALPGIALSAWAFGSLVSGAVVVESVFALPGIGRALVTAVTQRDMPLVAGIALVSAVAYVVVLAVADVVERLVDPRGRTTPATRPPRSHSRSDDDRNDQREVRSQRNAQPTADPVRSHLPSDGDGDDRRGTRSQRNARSAADPVRSHFPSDGDGDDRRGVRSQRDGDRDGDGDVGAGDGTGAR